MLSTFSIPTCGALGGRLLREMVASLRGASPDGLVGMSRAFSGQGFGTRYDVQSVCERKHGISLNILEWLNSDRDNWSGEDRRQPGLI